MALVRNKGVLPLQPFSRTAVATTAETAFHAPTAASVPDLLVPADNVYGARITSIYCIARAAIGTANNAQLYKKVGSTYTFLDSVLMSVHTPGASVAAIRFLFMPTRDEPWELEPGDGLAVGIGLSVANGVVFRAQGGFYLSA